MSISWIRNVFAISLLTIELPKILVVIQSYKDLQTLNHLLGLCAIYNKIFGNGVRVKK